MGALIGAGKRLLTGESLFMTVFHNEGQARSARSAFAAPYPGKILPMHLAELGGELICQKDSFLCAAKGVSLGIAFNKRFGVGLFGGEGFIMQRLTGDGWVFVHAGGTLEERDARGRRDAARRHRLPGRAAAERDLRHPVRGRDQDARCSAARDCSSPRCAARARCGCSRCRSAGSRAASTPRRRRPADAARGRLDPRRARQPARRRRAVTPPIAGACTAATTTGAAISWSAMHAAWNAGIICSPRPGR